MERIGQGAVCITLVEVQKSKRIFRIRLIKEPLLLKAAQKTCQAFQTGWPLPLPAAHRPCLAPPASPLGQQNLSPPVCPRRVTFPAGCDTVRCTGSSAWADSRWLQKQHKNLTAVGKKPQHYKPGPLIQLKITHHSTCPLLQTMCHTPGLFYCIHNRPQGARQCLRTVPWSLAS